MRELDPEVGKPLFDAASDAFAEGRSLWTCVVIVASFTGAMIKMTNAPSTTDRVSTDELLNAIEKVGWRLEHVNHVYVQTTTATNPGARGMSMSGVGGHIEAHYVFRRSSAG